MIYLGVIHFPMHSIDGVQFLIIISLFLSSVHLFASVVFSGHSVIVIVPLTSMHTSL